MKQCFDITQMPLNGIVTVFIPLNGIWLSVLLKVLNRVMF